LTRTEGKRDEAVVDTDGGGENDGGSRTMLGLSMDLFLD
jgi:hypothetical protein